MPILQRYFKNVLTISLFFKKMYENFITKTAQILGGKKMINQCLNFERCKAIPVAILVAILLTASCVAPSLAQTGESLITTYESISVDTAYNMITSGSFPNLVILDVRNQSEYELGHLYGAILIPYYQLDTRIGELEEHANDEIIVYCKSGYRSQIACEILVNHNFTKVYNMLGGITAWIEAGYPIYTTYHHVTMNVVDGEISLEIEPLLLYQAGCVSCNGSLKCLSCESDSAFVNLTVIEQDAEHIVLLLIYEINETELEVTITTTKLWSYTECTSDYNKTAIFTKTQIAIEDKCWEYYSFSYWVQRKEYALTVYTRLEPLNPEIFETSFTEMYYMPTEGSELVSMEFVEINSSVTLSQLYAVLGKVAKEIGKVYEKTEDEILVQLAQNYYIIEKEAKSLSKLVEKKLPEYNKEIVESSAILMDHPMTCFWVLWWLVCIDWCDVLCSILFSVLCGPTCEALLCIYVPPLCPFAYVICTTGCGVGEAGCYIWCVNTFNCVIQWLTAG